MRFTICFPLFILLTAVLVAQESSETNDITDRVESAIVSRTNDFRKENELPRVSSNEKLTSAAKKFAEFMAETEKYGHRADGRTPAQRAKASGYQYCVVRENIAYRTNTGGVTADSLTEVFVQGWIDSPPHRENLLADYVTQTGVGVASSDGVTYYAVQLFGRPKSAAFKVEISNRSDQPQTIIAESNNSQDEFELPPRGVVRMKRCFPATITTKSGEQTILVKDAANLVIDDEGLETAQ
ncbi:Cysteine-rich secretory protein family protein [Stieleria maiorica]|uniref:Cysteine-rich secretory protein family protein n=1 Tax=Stieleria maiorica TaxID=2795974 RepID=A0A5B9MI84_9BACT|nr:CAP domain-containing protein [Stieleria maiorica]QEG00220.1 Cysteine-rich secretory protein family protein [Stieleria maiorica]